MRRAIRSRMSVAGLCFAFAVAAWVSMVPASAQNGRSDRVDRVNGFDAVAGDVIVKFRGTPSAAALANLQLQIDADKNERVGSNGARLLHSRSFDADSLARFLSTQP